jgi:hypothetical protein
MAFLSSGKQMVKMTRYYVIPLKQRRAFRNASLGIRNGNGSSVNRVCRTWLNCSSGFYSPSRCHAYKYIELLSNLGFTGEELGILWSVLVTYTIPVRESLLISHSLKQITKG